MAEKWWLKSAPPAPPSLAPMSISHECNQKVKEKPLVKVDRKRLASKGSVTSLRSKHLKAATLLVTFFAVFNQTNALAAIKSAPIKVLPKIRRGDEQWQKWSVFVWRHPWVGGPNLNTILLDPLQNVSTLQGKEGLVCREATGLIALWSLDPKP